ncbi:MAG TPA: histidine phosphatase family protein [Anaerolineae bacterium]|nr:histidine phosphatase family protein [Anaerolineae bacterium]
MTTHPRTLILIRHANSHPQPGTPPHHWPLTAKGRQRAPLLAPILRPYLPLRLFTSTEPKAHHTGQLLGQALGLPATPIPNLHEHERATMPWFDTVAEFQAQVKNFYQHPDELVLGEETAHTVQQRITTTINTLWQDQAPHNLAIVSHGTALTLYLAALTRQDPILLWLASQTAGMPAYTILHPNQPPTPTTWHPL